jgi:hypothetical protein
MRTTRSRYPRYPGGLGQTMWRRRTRSTAFGTVTHSTGALAPAPSHSIRRSPQAGPPPDRQSNPACLPEPRVGRLSGGIAAPVRAPIACRLQRRPCRPGGLWSAPAEAVRLGAAAVHLNLAAVFARRNCQTQPERLAQCVGDGIRAPRIDARQPCPQGAVAASQERRSRDHDEHRLDRRQHCAVGRHERNTYPRTYRPLGWGRDSKLVQPIQR